MYVCVPKAPERTIEYWSYKNYSKQEFLIDLRDIEWDQALNKDDIDSAFDDWNDDDLRTVSEWFSRNLPTLNISIENGLLMNCQ